MEKMRRFHLLDGRHKPATPYVRPLGDWVKAEYALELQSQIEELDRKLAVMVIVAEASENLLNTCEVDFFARRDGTADAVVRKDYWNKWASAVRALKAPAAVSGDKQEKERE